MLFGVSLTSAVSAGVIMASIPAVALSWAFLRERIGPRIWGAVLCGDRHALLAGPGWGMADDRAQQPRGWNVLVFGAVREPYAVIGKVTSALGPSGSSSSIVGPRARHAVRRGRPCIRLTNEPGIWACWCLAAGERLTVWLWMTAQESFRRRRRVFTVMLPAPTALVGVFALGETRRASPLARPRRGRSLRRSRQSNV
jgi:hypothetical protein